MCFDSWLVKANKAAHHRQLEKAQGSEKERRIVYVRVRAYVYGCVCVCVLSTEATGVDWGTRLIAVGRGWAGEEFRFNQDRDYEDS